MQWFKTRDNEGKKEVFDPVRRKFVALTPEEEVRQTTLYHLITELGMPSGLISVEHSLRLNQLDKRCDIVVFSTEGRPLMIVECKAAHIPISQQVLDQATRYNQALQVEYLLLTNSKTSYCVRCDFLNNQIDFLDYIPAYSQLQENFQFPASDISDENNA